MHASYEQHEHSRLKQENPGPCAPVQQKGWLLDAAVATSLRNMRTQCTRCRTALRVLQLTAHLPLMCRITLRKNTLIAPSLRALDPGKHLPDVAPCSYAQQHFAHSSITALAPHLGTSRAVSHAIPQRRGVQTTKIVLPPLCAVPSVPLPQPSRRASTVVLHLICAPFWSTAHPESPVHPSAPRSPSIHPPLYQAPQDSVTLPSPRIA